MVAAPAIAIAAKGITLCMILIITNLEQDAIIGTTYFHIHNTALAQFHHHSTNKGKLAATTEIRVATLLGVDTIWTILSVLRVPIIGAQEQRGVVDTYSHQ